MKRRHSFTTTPSEIPRDVAARIAEKKIRYRLLARRTCTREPEDRSKRKCRWADGGMTGRGEWLMKSVTTNNDAATLGYQVLTQKQIQRQQTSSSSLTTRRIPPNEPKVLASYTYLPQDTAQSAESSASPHSKPSTPSTLSTLYSLASTTCTELLTTIFNASHSPPPMIEYTPAQIARNTDVYFEAQIIQSSTQLQPQTQSSPSVVLLLHVRPCGGNYKERSVGVVARHRRVREVQGLAGVSGLEEVFLEGY